MLARTMLTRPAMNDFARMSREMDRLFESFGPAWPGASGAPGASASKGVIAPPVNLWQDGANLYAEAELPGVAIEDIEILASGDSLTIKGSRRIERDENSEGVIRAERVSGAFERTLTLPVEIDPDKVGASLRDGVLTVTLPKAQAVLPRRITVNAG